MGSHIVNPTVCFVEGFKFKAKVEALQRDLKALWQLEQKRPLVREAEGAVDLVSTIRQEVETIANVDGCLSAELKGAIQYNAARISSHFVDLFGTRDWGSVDSHLEELESIMERWTSLVV